MRRHRRIRCLLLAVFSTIVLATGCDPTVQAFESSDRYHYSVFGILNPAQDTQWVRVEPIGPPTSEGAPRTLDVTVTLENVKTGRRWQLRDSVMEVARGEPQHNFWTAAPIAPGATYRLVVRNEEGDTTQATTTTPSAPPDARVSGAILLPCSEVCPDANTFQVRVRTTKELAGLKVRYFQTFPERAPIQGSAISDFDWYEEVTQRRGSKYVVRVNYLDNLRAAGRTMEQLCIADSAQVIATIGGPDWPEWAQYHGATISTIARPDSFSSVQGGHGMVAGVYSGTTRVEVRPRQSPPRCDLY